MLTPQQLNQELKEVAESGYQVPSEDRLLQLCEAMMAELGTTDSELRDDLIYLTFAHWITESRLNPDLLHLLRQSVLDDHHLFNKIGNADPDAVFTRSFSALLLALLVYAHRQHAYLTLEEVQRTLDTALTYVYAEADYRGFVPGQGWAHAAAHTADLLDELAQCKEFGQDEILLLLRALAHLVSRDSGVYVNDEDERLSICAMSLVKRQILDPQHWTAWIDSMTAMDQGNAEFPLGYNRRINTRHFLRALYFRLRSDPHAASLDPVFTAALSTDLERGIHQVTKF